MRVQFVDAGANRMAGICFSVLRRYVPTLLKHEIYKDGLWEDMEQEVYLTAWEAWQKGLSETETYRLMGRRLYGFLKSYGYRAYRHGYYRMEKPLSSVAKDQKHEDKILARAVPQPAFISGEDHLREKILEIIGKSRAGLSKRDLYNRLAVSAWELDCHLAPLIRQGEVTEVLRENSFGRPPTPLLVVGSAGIPERGLDRDERIRQAYFRDGKSIKQIVKEFHHCKKTVRKAILAIDSPGEGSINRLKEYYRHRYRRIPGKAVAQAEAIAEAKAKPKRSRKRDKLAVA